MGPDRPGLAVDRGVEVFSAGVGVGEADPAMSKAFPRAKALHAKGLDLAALLAEYASAAHHASS